MSAVLVVTIVLLWIGLYLFVSGVARRNAQDAKRCPKCRYDVSKTTEGRCPECGCAWSSAAELLRRPARRGRLLAGAMLLMIAGWLTLFPGSHWTEWLPRPVLAFALEIFTEEQPVPPGGVLPLPDMNLIHAQSRWDRLLWQKQSVRAIEAFLHMAETSDGTIEDVIRLLPAAHEAHDLFIQRSGTKWVDANVLRPMLQRAIGRTIAADRTKPLPIGTWAASELQYFSGTSYRDARFLSPPLEILEPLSVHEDLAVRQYALSRLWLLDDPRAMAVIERMYEDDDEVLGRAAREVRQWQRTVHGWP